MESETCEFSEDNEELGRNNRLAPDYSVIKVVFGTGSYPKNRRGPQYDPIELRAEADARDFDLIRVRVQVSDEIRVHVYSALQALNNDRQHTEVPLYVARAADRSHR